jgi:CRISPR-associated protein Csm2
LDLNDATERRKAMLELVEGICKLCDEIDKNKQDFSKRKLSENERKSLNDKKKKLVNDLHKAVDVMKEAFIEKIRETGFSQMPMSELVASAEAIGRYLSYEIKINKIRRFLDGLRRIEVSKEYDPQVVVLLRPKLAYAVGKSDRDEKEFMKRFLEYLDPVLKIISESKDKLLFYKGLKLMESIIAYHRYYGGEN